MTGAAAARTVGVDLGTTGIRAVVLDPRSGEILDAATRPVRVTTDGDAVTSDPAEIVAATVEVIAEATRGHVADVAAIGFSVQGEAFVPVDTAGHAVGPVPLSMDRRGRPMLPRVADTLGEKEFQVITGQPLHAMFAGFKMVAGDAEWRADRYLGLGDHLLAVLGGEPLTDFTQAARTGLFDVERRVWSAPLIDAVGLTDAFRRLPRVAASGTSAGHLSATMADRTGLRMDTRLVVGMHDQAAAFVGGGGDSDGTAVFSLGSSECLTVASQSRPDIIGTGLACYPTGSDQWLVLAGTAAGGWGLQWLARFVGIEEPRARQEFLNAPPDTPTEVLLLPYFTGSGTLDNNPYARGVISGLSLDTRPADLVRAMYESSGYEAAKILDALSGQVRVTGIRAVGAGSGNRAALQVRADAADWEIVSGDLHAAARGAATIAARGAGLDVCGALAPSSALVPRPAHRDHHRRRRESYRQLYSALALPNGTGADTMTEEPRGNHHP